MENYLPRGKASKILGIHWHTLYSLAKNNKIESIKVGEHTVYNVGKFLEDKGVNNTQKNKKNICYCRVSSNKQKENLICQINFMKKQYPFHEIIYDIASSLDYNRPGLQQILKYAIKGHISEIVIAYKDRLAHFGYELIEWIIKETSHGKIKIINNNDETPIVEINKDLMTIMNLYTTKIKCLKKYKTLIKEELKELEK